MIDLTQFLIKFKKKIQKRRVSSHSLLSHWICHISDFMSKDILVPVFRLPFFTSSSLSHTHTHSLSLFHTHTHYANRPFSNCGETHLSCIDCSPSNLSFENTVANKLCYCVCLLGLAPLDDMPDGEKFIRLPLEPFYPVKL